MTVSGEMTLFVTVEKLTLTLVTPAQHVERYQAVDFIVSCFAIAPPDIPDA